MATPARTGHQNRGVGFFEQHQLKRTNSVTIPSAMPQWVYLGSGEKSAYFAVAASLLDKLACGRSIPDSVLKKILARHFSLFPNQKPISRGLQTLQERFQLLIKQEKPLALVQALAQTIHQLTIDEIKANPKRYAPALMSEYTGVRSMDEWSGLPLAAIARALGCNIELMAQAHDQVMPLRVKFNGGSDLGVIIQKINNAYLPRIKQHAYAARLKELSRMNTEDHLKIALDDELVTDMMDELTSVYESYMSMCKHLKVMCDSGDISEEDLKSLYSDVVSQEVGGQEVKFAGAEMGSQTVIEWIKLIKDKLNFETISLENTMSDALIHAIASSVSLGNSDLEVAFNALEAGAPGDTRSPGL